MKLSLRNLVMGTALAVSTASFAQEMPFTVTETFNHYTTPADVVSLGDTRNAAAYKGTVYALNKATGQIFAINAEGVKEYAKVDVNHGENNDHVSTAITADDAGNLVVGYANGDFFANSLKGVAIVPADGSDVIYVETLEFPEGFSAGRTDNFGRIAGDVLSTDGAYFYVGGAGSGKNVACFYVSEGEFTAEEYASDAYVNDVTSMSVAFPMFTSFDEQCDTDPVYNGGILFNWNASGPEYIADSEGHSYGRPAKEDGIDYTAVPGGDCFTYEGKRYFAIPYTQITGKRTGDFLIYDEDLNVIFKSQFADYETVAAGGFLNGGAILVQQTGENTFELGFWGGATTGVHAASYTITFPKAEEPVDPNVITVKETFSHYTTPADVVSLGDTRNAAAYKGTVYALNKATGQIFAINAEGVKEYAKVDVNHGENNDHVSTAITADDAGNLVVGYANGDFFANSLKGVAIVPADGSDVIYVETLEFPEGFSAGRTDNFGRIAGDVLSTDGAYFYVGGAGSGKNVACFYVSEGEFTAEEYASDAYVNDVTGMSVAFPMFTSFDEQCDVDPIYNGGILLNWNASGPEYITDSEGHSYGRPAKEDGIDYTAVPGGDCFTYNGKRYFAIPYTQIAGKRTGDFLIYDEDLNVIFKSQFADYETVAAGGFLNGGAILVQQTGENTFELGFWGGATTGVHAASYTITMPKETVDPQPTFPAQLYLVGAPNGWQEPTEANADKYTNYTLAPTAEGSGIYTGTFQVNASQAMFRFFTTLGGWDAEQYGLAEGDSPVDITLTDNTFEGTLVAGKGSVNIPDWTGGEIEMTVNLNDKSIKLVCTPGAYKPVDLYLRGEFNDWGTTLKMETPAEADADGYYIYTATVESLAGEFKIANDDWTFSYGCGAEAPSFENGQAYDTYYNGSNFTIAGESNVTVTFALNPNTTEPSKITLAWEGLVQGRNNFAYAINLVDNGNGKYTVTYKATGAAPATLYYVGDNGVEGTLELPDAVEGENSFEVDGAKLDEGSYNFSIALANDTYATAPALVFTGEQYELAARGGMVVINDPESDAFGYSITCAGNAQGMQLFDPTFNFLGQFHKGYDSFTASNQSSPFRGAEREGVAVFGDYSDNGANYYVFDPLNPTELSTMLGAPATMAPSGLWSLDGVEIAGGNSGIAFRGTGADTQMFTVIEDNTEHSNTLAQYDLGDATMITEAPVKWFTTANAMLPNHNVEIAVATNGMYIAQIRANVDENNICRMLYVDYNDDVKASWWNDMIPNACGAVAITTDETILAVGTKTEILFFEIDMNEETNVPELLPLEEWTIPMVSEFSEYRFDVAGNLYVYNREQKGMTVYALPLGQESVTPAKKALLIKGSNTGVENIAVDAADTNAVYYTIGGVQVSAEDLTPGIYVKVVGNTATKVVVK
ncbi:MAG: hypothetical protein NC405_07090 [Odoribacter sp.]|nr:hypothetical protein [Odoribacter sp.]